MPPSPIAAVVLAGGQAQRMGGVDKGLQQVKGRALVDWTLLALQGQQPWRVTHTVICANRHLTHYQSRGYPVCTDGAWQGAGPLAGMAAGMAHIAQHWPDCQHALIVPCDSPLLPSDLLYQLWQCAAQGGHRAAVAASDAPPGSPNAGLQHHFSTCLVPLDALDNLHAFLASGQRKLSAWLAQIGYGVAHYASAETHGYFFNANYPEDLERLAQHWP